MLSMLNKLPCFHLTISTWKFCFCSSVSGCYIYNYSSCLLLRVIYLLLFDTDFLTQVDVSQGAICVIASQIANFGESLIGAALQDKEGFQWVRMVFNSMSSPLWMSLSLLFHSFFSKWQNNTTSTPFSHISGYIFRNSQIPWEWWNRQWKSLDHACL